MATIMLGIGDYAAAKDPGEVIKTMALGSCVAVILLDPATQTAGMVHVALPDSTLNAEKKEKQPGYFADSGIPALLEEMKKHGVTNGIRDMYVKLVGGANVLQSSMSFDIGKRNILTVKKILWQLGTGPVAEDVGGHISRTVAVSVDTGSVEISCPGKGVWTI